MRKYKKPAYIKARIEEMVIKGFTIPEAAQIAYSKKTYQNKKRRGKC